MLCFLISSDRNYAFSGKLQRIMGEIESQDEPKHLHFESIYNKTSYRLRNIKIKSKCFRALLWK